MQSYGERAKTAKNSTAKRLLSLIERKQTNLCVAADVTTADQLLDLAQQVGKQICLLKTHIDTIEDFTDDVVRDLLALAGEYQFLIFEDRKFADIGSTVQLQYAGGIYHIAEWADIVNAHVVPGPGVIAGLKTVGMPKQRGLLLIAEMSSEGSLATGEYSQAAYGWAEENDDFVIGFIGKGSPEIPKSMIVMTPGVNAAQHGDSLGQHYQTPEQAIASGSDVIIVGRGVYRAPNPAAAAAEYQQAGWQAYQKVSTSHSS